MCEGRHISWANNRVRVSPYPLRSSRNNIHHAPELAIQPEWEDARCVICIEPPHNAALLQCCSSFNGCRPYKCDTSARHSNCFKKFRGKNMISDISCKRLNPIETLNCPLCRGEVIEMTTVTSTGRWFMNAKPRSFPVNDCEFSGTYSKLDKHLKTEHPDLFESVMF
ncbi:hypothetical protein V5N11_004516 [Cardamine amara subsp. amara]|uniref:RING-type E3 ubiquitin transferase n=1 Tax=Cardamine amara subsp. amara TaxID=228776 RepID=A0ABD1C3G1_CARAN